MTELEPDEEWTESYDGLEFDDSDLITPEDEDMLNSLFSRRGTLVRDLYQEGIDTVINDPAEFLEKPSEF